MVGTSNLSVPEMAIVSMDDLSLWILAPPEKVLNPTNHTLNAS